MSEKTLFDLPTKASTVYFDVVNIGDEIVREQLQPRLITVPVATGHDLVNLGLDLMAQETGISREQIMQQTKGPKILTSQDETYIEGCRIELDGQEWVFVCNSLGGESYLN